MLFASFFSCGFITAIIVNPSERKLAKCNSLQWTIFPKVIGLHERIKILTPNIKYQRISGKNWTDFIFDFFQKGLGVWWVQKLNGFSTWTTKSLIRGKHWVLLVCRALLGSVRPLCNSFWNYWFFVTSDLTFLTPLSIQTPQTQGITTVASWSCW